MEKEKKKAIESYLQMSIRQTNKKSIMIVDDDNIKNIGQKQEKKAIRITNKFMKMCHNQTSKKVILFVHFYFFCSTNCY